MVIMSILSNSLYSSELLTESSVIDKLIQYSKIPNKAKRLQSYDKLAKATAKIDQTSITHAPQQFDSNWDVKIEDSPMDNSKKIFLTLYSKKTSSGEQAIITIRYSNNWLDVLVSSGKYIGIDQQRSRIKFDKNKPRLYVWNISSDGTALFAAKANWFIRDLLKHKTMHIEIPRYGKQATVFTFDISKLKDVIDPIDKTGAL